MRIGFVGTGAIARAIVLGLLDGGADDVDIALSPRNAATAAELAARFPRRATACTSNQAVLDASEVVVVAVVPGIVRDVLSALRFRPDHVVVSLAATVPMELLAAVAAPATRIVRAIPLPSAAERASPTPIMPPDPVAKSIFDRTGISIETTEPRAFDALSAASGVMAGYFAAAGAVAGWLRDRGLGAGEADAYVRLLFAGLAGTAGRSGSSFEELAKEHTTEGGLNEQFLRHLADRGAEETIRSGLDALLARIGKAAAAQG